MGKLSRAKGADFERDMAIELRVLYPSARRGAQMQARLGHAPSSSEKFADVEGTPWWIECKHGKAVSIPAALAQGTAATDGRAVIAVTRIDRCDILATMYFRDFQHLLRDVVDARTLRLEIAELRAKHQRELVDAVEAALRDARERM